jgi:hypothetical protein
VNSEFGDSPQGRRRRSMWNPTPVSSRILPAQKLDFSWERDSV